VSVSKVKRYLGLGASLLLKDDEWNEFVEANAPGVQLRSVQDFM
jgi:hypothetical protein